MLIAALGAIVSLTLLAAVLVLPVVLFLRSLRLQSEITSLARRVDDLERRQDVRHSEGVVRSEVVAPSVSTTPVDVPRSPSATSPPPHVFQHIPRVVTAEPDLLRDAVERVRELDLESRIGGRWLQHAGIVVLILGVAFFLRYAFEQAWLPPVVRVALGAITGTAMAVGGVRLARTYRPYGLMLSGGGVAVLYLSVYAALNLYELVGAQVAFGLLAVVSIVAALLADRTGSFGLAFIAVCGGYATPFLVGGDRDQHLILFTYVALLVAATTYLAHRRTWPWLNVTSLVLTTVTVLAWAAAYYRPSLYLRAELFMALYCAMFVEILRKVWRPGAPAAPAVLFLLLAPVGYHVWSVVTLAPHGLAFLIYLLGFTLVTVLTSVHYASSLLRVAAWLAMAVPLGNWIAAHHWQGWIAASTITILAIYCVHAAVQIRSVRAGEELDDPDVFLLHANAVGVFAVLFGVLTDSLTTGELALVALGFAGVNVGVWAALRRHSPVTAFHWLGAAFTLVAIATWIHLGGPWAVATWVTEGVVVLWVASRAQRRWLRVGAWALMAIAAHRWSKPDIQQTTTAHVVLVNARALTGIYLVAMAYVAAWLQRGPQGAPAKHRRREQTTFVIAANLVTLVVISTEIVSFWALRTTSPDAYFARDMMLSASWVLYAAALVVAGIKTRYAPIRYFAIGLFGIALTKVFLLDLATTRGIYRVVGFLLVGVVLLSVSFFYQRARAKGALH